MFSWFKKKLKQADDAKKFDEMLYAELADQYAHLEREPDNRLPLDPGKSELR